MEVSTENLDNSFVLCITLKSKSTLEDVEKWLSENKKDLVEEKLTKHSTVLFRGFPVTNAKEFHRFLVALNVEFGSYCGGGGPRIEVQGGVIHTSTETPSHLVIPFHHELAYLTTSPSKLAFFCEIPAKKDGYTPLCLSHTLYEKIKSKNPKFIERLEAKKVRYTRIIQSKKLCENTRQRSWQEVFETEDPKEAEKKAHLTGTEKVEFNEDYSLMKVTSIAMDAIRIDDRTKQPTWFNSVVLLHPAGNNMSKEERNNAPWETTYGDGSTIEDEDIISVADIMKNEGIKFDWKANDVILVDNYLALHARTTFEGPRRVLATILK